MPIKEWPLGWIRPTWTPGIPTRWNWVVLGDHLQMGEGVAIGAFTLLVAHRPLFLGDDVGIGSHCAIYTEDSLTPREGPVVIGDRTQVGSHSTILPMVSIGADSVIGAHSFVNSDIPDGVLAYGVPAKVIRRIA